MSESSTTPSNELFYIAPSEVPPSRRPPALTVGLIGWLRKNLFSNWLNSLMTVLTVILIVLGIYEFVRWSVAEANWSAVTDNLGLISYYLYDEEHLWRIEVFAIVLVFLSGLSISIWGNFNRPLFLTIIAVVMIFILIPPVSNRVEPAPVRFMAAAPTNYGYLTAIPGQLIPQKTFADYPVGPMMFVGDEGDTIKISVEPINRQSYLNEEDTPYDGWVENTTFRPAEGRRNPGFISSYSLWTEEITNAVSFSVENLELSDYNLLMEVRLLDANQQVLQTFISTPENPATSVEFTLKDNGWYIVEAIKYPSGTVYTDDTIVPAEVVKTTDYILERVFPDGTGITPFSALKTYRYQTYKLERPVDGWVLFGGSVTQARGFAWIRLDGIRILPSKEDELAPILEQYGERPTWATCNPNLADCVYVPNNRTLRFVGEQTFAQYLKYPVGNFVNRSATAFIIGIIVLLNALFMGYFARQSSPKTLKRVARFTVLGWFLSIPFTWFMVSGISGLEDVIPLIDLTPVNSEKWGGIVLTLLLTAIPMILSFPIGILLALGRQSNLPVINIICTAFIEIVRGVPLITILFLGSLLVPYFDRSLLELNDVIRMIVGLTFFTAAYLAEVIRGGLQIIPKGHIEAARALGLNNVYTTLFIILPQALRAVIPAIMGQFVSLFKDTSLVALIGMFDLLGVLRGSISNGQRDIYGQVQREVFIFALLFYFIVSFAMSVISRRLEETGSGAVRLN